MDDVASHRTTARNVLTRSTCPSTQDIVREEALAGAPAGTIAVTDHQSAGRGRRGRTWEAPAGKALMFSYLARPTRPSEELATLSLVTGIVVAECLPLPTGLRWPNDLVIGGSKVCGILVELVTPPSGLLFAIIGVGINANLTADELPPTDRLPATSLLLAGGKEIDRIALLEQLGSQLDAALDEFDRHGLAPFVPRYAALDALNGLRLTLRLPDREVPGTAAGIDSNGHLLLTLEDGSEQAFAAGEVERVLD